MNNDRGRINMKDISTAIVSGGISSCPVGNQHIGGAIKRKGIHRRKPPLWTPPRPAGGGAMGRKSGRRFVAGVGRTNAQTPVVQKVKGGVHLNAKCGICSVAKSAKLEPTSMKHGPQAKDLKVEKIVQATASEYGFDVARFIEHISTYKHEVLDAVFTARPEPEVVPQELGFIKSNYRFENVAACSYEFFMPIKNSYKVVRDLILDAFMTEDGVKNIPAVKAYLDLHPVETDALVGTLMDVVTGSSRFDVDGRYYSIDEKSQVVKVIVTDSHGNGGMRESFHELATAVITRLISGRFAQCTGLEKQVWLAEFPLRIHKAIRVSANIERRE